MPYNISYGSLSSADKAKVAELETKLHSLSTLRDAIATERSAKEKEWNEKMAAIMNAENAVITELKALRSATIQTV